MVQNSLLTDIFSPGQIGSMALRNRIVMPPMGTLHLSDEGFVTDNLINYHRARAKGQVGINITEVTCIDSRTGKTNVRQLTVDDDKYIPGLRKLARAIQEEGSKAVLQLQHAGSAARSIFIGGQQPVSASPIRTIPAAEVPRSLTVEEIGHLVSQFANAAKRAKEAGFNGVEIHAAHAYLLAQFLSRVTNQRKDEYGGSHENRARFLLEVIRAIRSMVGRDYPVWYRINGEDAAGGFTIDEAKEITIMAEEIGIDAVHVSGSPSTRSVYKPRGWGLPLTREMKKAVKVPVIAVGSLDMELGNEAIKNGWADFIALGRPLIADPDLPRKAANHQLEDVRPCIHCGHCLFEDLSKGEKLGCSVNAMVGMEVEYQIVPAAKTKKVLVVGGGPGGLEAARGAALRGHQVTLYDRNDRLGGQLLLAAKPPCKSEIKDLTEYLVRQVSRLGVKIKLGEEVDPALVTDIKPDVVIVATGNSPVVPPIPGINQKNVASAEDVLSDRVKVGRDVVVLGGGLVGCETAHLLAAQGKRITIVEMLPKMAMNVSMGIRMDLLDALAKKEVKMLTSVRVTEINPRGMVITETDGNQQNIRADNIIVAAGSVSNRVLAEKLENKVPELYLIGDAKEPRRILDAISEGFHAARMIST